MSDLAGSEFGLYEILDQISVGGMSTVFKGYHAALDRYAAIKVLPEQMGRDDELRQRFQQEVRVIARLEHAHILPIYDYGEDGGRLYLVMRYVESGTLADRLAQGPMGLSEISRVMHQVGAALTYAHGEGIVHRDIKPSNVLIDAQGNCYLSDFGLAKILEASIRLTSTGVGMGTPAYMSPEQGKGDRVDARSDVYSLGVMLYEMATGQVPYTANSPMAVMLKHITDPLPLPRQVNPALSPELEQVIVKALAKEPGDRFRSVPEMLAAYDAAVMQTSQPVVMLAVPPRKRKPRKPRKTPAWVFAMAGAALLALIVASALWLPRVFAGGRWEQQATETAVALAMAWTAEALQATATPRATSVPSPTSTPSPTALPSATPRPTHTATATITHTPTASPTPTEMPTHMPTATISPTRTPTYTPTKRPAATATPTARWLPAPTLLSPPDGTSFIGWNASVVLRWSAVEGLQAGEYYVVRIPYDGAGSVAEFWREETYLSVPAHFSLSEVGFEDRHYDWTVQVMRCMRNCVRLLEDDAKKQGVAVGGESAAGLFYWQPDIVQQSPTPENPDPPDLLSEPPPAGD